MSETGWRGFVDAEGMADWVVLHGGATGVFDTGSFTRAVELAGLVASVLGSESDGCPLTVRGTRVTVRLTRDLWHLEDDHLALARRISEVTRDVGATAVREAVQEVQVAVAARPDEGDIGFWRAALGYDPASDDNAIDPLGHGSTVWLQELDPDRPLRHAMHLDVSVPRDRVQARVAAAVAAGGRIVVADEPSASWILSDPAGNRVCVTAWPDGAASG